MPVDISFTNLTKGALRMQGAMVFCAFLISLRATVPCRNLRGAGVLRFLGALRARIRLRKCLTAWLVRAMPLASVRWL